MALLEDDTQVFVVRIWFEHRELENVPVEWRGVIEHVRTGQRRYIKDLAGIIAFIDLYLEMVVDSAKPRRRWRRWLKQKFWKVWRS